MTNFINKLNKNTIEKGLKILLTILKLVIEIIIIMLALIIITQIVTDNEKSFFGYRILSVASESMEPEYKVGDILICKEQEPGSIQIGDNIAYVGKLSKYNGKIITHSVVRKEQNEKGEYLFYTKGISNIVEDPVVHENQLYGKIVDNNIVLTYTYKIVTNKYALCFIIIMPILLYGIIRFIKVKRKTVEEHKEEPQTNKEEQATEKELQEEQVIIQKDVQTSQQIEEEQKRIHREEILKLMQVKLEEKDEAKIQKEALVNTTNQEEKKPDKEEKTNKPKTTKKATTTNKKVSTATKSTVKKKEESKKEKDKTENKTKSTTQSKVKSKTGNKTKSKNTNKSKNETEVKPFEKTTVTRTRKTTKTEPNENI